MWPPPWRLLYLELGWLWCSAAESLGLCRTEAASPLNNRDAANCQSAWKDLLFLTLLLRRKPDSFPFDKWLSSRIRSHTVGGTSRIFLSSFKKRMSLFPSIFKLWSIKSHSGSRWLQSEPKIQAWPWNKRTVPNNCSPVQFLIWTSPIRTDRSGKGQNKRKLSNCLHQQSSRIHSSAQQAQASLLRHSF